MIGGGFEATADLSHESNSQSSLPLSRSLPVESSFFARAASEARHMPSLLRHPRHSCSPHIPARPRRASATTAKLLVAPRCCDPRAIGALMMWIVRLTGPPADTAGVVTTTGHDRHFPRPRIAERSRSTLCDFQRTV